ncbi:MAG: 23S rRNA (adenine(2030)-N(6))-methyltransferase RlmJ [Proteobacteria bacterium]|nr:23S rRNA (adenine(2030)-N(6))-methyltransferase RlmJ [Pseudomonadota bacterium]
MFSYQHIYHAGSLADVHKHALLAVLLEYLAAKEPALSYFETHAGRGVYDLSAPEAKKTGEAKLGILSLLKDRVLPKDHPFMRALATFVRAHGPKMYPGSPSLAQILLRPDDALHFMELHPQEFDHLRRHFAHSHAHVSKRDGYQGVWALSPPTPRRGVVLIDPSYEDKGEYARTVDFAEDLATRWCEATLMVWYPVLRAGHEAALRQAVARSTLSSKTWELSFPAKVTGYGLTGTGVTLFNVPTGVEESLNATHALLDTWLQGL